MLVGRRDADDVDALAAEGLDGAGEELVVLVAMGEAEVGAGPEGEDGSVVCHGEGVAGAGGYLGDATESLKCLDLLRRGPVQVVTMAELAMGVRPARVHLPVPRQQHGEAETCGSLRK